MSTSQNEMTARVAFADAIAPKFEKRYDADRVDIKLAYGLYEIAWIETKRADTDEARMFAQLILTAKPLLERGALPPMLLGTYDTKDVAFVRFADVLPVFALNDINWNETPSAPSEKTIAAVRNSVAGKIRLFPAADLDAVRDWLNSGTLSVDYIPINASNFVHIFRRWMAQVWPTIALPAKLAATLQPADFYLADIMSDNNRTFITNLKVLLRGNRYKVSVTVDDDLFREIQFKDDAAAHAAFWNAYKRPPKREFQNLILTRRDLLIAQDIRERKGAFFTPQRWVEKAHEYLARAFGENWAEENLVWDCAAGTGNLLAGLGNKRNVFASDYDAANVRVMKDGNIVFADHAFQFDFLNGALDEIPAKIRAAAEAGNLVILINPPYADSGNKVYGADQKVGVNRTSIRDAMMNEGMKKSVRELFAQFIFRIKRDFPKAKLGVFSKLKYVNSQNFIEFREYWTAEFFGGFVVPADTFDNVKGSFPIGFLTWNLDSIKRIDMLVLDVFSKEGESLGQKTFWSYDGKLINDWLKSDDSRGAYGYVGKGCSDYQNVGFVEIRSTGKQTRAGAKPVVKIDGDNLLQSVVFIAVQHCIPHTWLNDRDQFLHPFPTWETDEEFKTDSLVFALFHTQNHIDSHKGANHWIPFDETQLNSRRAFASDFMARFLQTRARARPLSPEAAEVLAAGLAIWKHYFAQQSRSDFNHNAGFYEIKEFFRGRNDKGRLKSTGNDATFETLMEKLAAAYKPLAAKLATKCYEHGFLSILRPNPANHVPQTKAEPAFDFEK